MMKHDLNRPTATFVAEVTEEDIRLGDRCHSLSCPLARALVRAAAPTFGMEGLKASVGVESASIFRDSGMLAYGNLDEAAVLFRRDFDSMSCVEGGAFLVEMEIYDDQWMDKDRRI